MALFDLRRIALGRQFGADVKYLHAELAEHFIDFQHEAVGLLRVITDCTNGRSLFQTTVRLILLVDYK